MKIAKAVIISIILVLGMTGVISALNPHEDGQTGQPNKSCGTDPALFGPGNAPNAPGSAFNEIDGVAGGVYAGNGVSADHANSPNAVSQYDVACWEVSQESNGQTTEIILPSLP